MSKNGKAEALGFTKFKVGRRFFDTYDEALEYCHAVEQDLAGWNKDEKRWVYFYVYLFKSPLRRFTFGGIPYSTVQAAQIDARV